LRDNTPGLESDGALLMKNVTLDECECKIMIWA